MSLFFKERIDEQQKEQDPLNGKFTFTYPWIITITPQAQNQKINFQQKFATCYQNGNELWDISLMNDLICISAPIYRRENLSTVRIWNDSTCFVSYNLYYDNDMRYLFYSSMEIELDESSKTDEFKTPKGYMAKMSEALINRKLSKIVIFVELQLPAKYFYLPFCSFSFKVCDGYPMDMEKDSRFGFMKEGDFVIKCSDGEMLACRTSLKDESEYMKKLFEYDVEELAINFSMEIIKPILIYFHTLCFEMPETYNLDYANRLCKAIDFFEIVHAEPINESIHLSLCNKFVQDPHDFDSILQWAGIVSHFSRSLEYMVATVIVNKFYFKWQQTFPPNARNNGNPLYRQIFGYYSADIFETVDSIYMRSFLTNVILD